VAGLAVTVVTGLGTAAPALASTPSVTYRSYVKSDYSSGVNLRTCGAVTCRSIACMPNGTGVNMICWEDTTSVSPPQSNYTSSRWFKVSAPDGTGLVHSPLVFNQTSVGAC
jgi:hypothetical protein